MEIGNKIFESRKKKKMSQEQLAEKLNVTRQTISNWELNQTLPDIKQTEEMAKIFNVTLDELVGNDIKDVLVDKVNSTQENVNNVEKILKVMLISIIFFIIFFIILMIFSIYLFVHNNKYNDITENNYINDNNENNNKNVNILDQAKEAGVIEIRGILNGVTAIYAITYAENGEIIDILCKDGSVGPNMNFNDSYFIMFNSIDRSVLEGRFKEMNHKIEETVDYIKKYYEYHGGTWEVIDKNDEDYLFTIYDTIEEIKLLRNKATNK